MGAIGHVPEATPHFVRRQEEWGDKSRGPWVLSLSNSLSRRSEREREKEKRARGQRHIPRQNEASSEGGRHQRSLTISSSSLSFIFSLSLALSPSLISSLCQLLPSISEEILSEFARKIKVCSRRDGARSTMAD